MIEASSQFQAIAGLSIAVGSLVAGGVSLPAEGKALQSKRDAALRAKDAKAAQGNLYAFKNQVEAFVKNKKLMAAQGKQLIDAILVINGNLGD